MESSRPKRLFSRLPAFIPCAEPSRLWRKGKQPNPNPKSVFVRNSESTSEKSLQGNRGENERESSEHCWKALWFFSHRDVYRNFLCTGGRSWWSRPFSVYNR